MRELAYELEDSRAAYVAMDVDAVYRHASLQKAICERLHEIEQKHAANMKDTMLSVATAAGESALPERAQKALADMSLAERRARQLHRTHVVVLEGTRRTIQMMANALVSFSPLYSRPAKTVDAESGQV
jgi:hypothetical protein